ncbi:MAG TPA: DUF5668 domain-containing protein [Coriobacteriia bacterium]|nr:DUF5668 domain-containing protein [Coriobacteriia bacterium]
MLWGITLIIVGGLLLVSQFVPGIALWRYWPLIIVAIGVRQALGPASGSWSIKHAVDGLVTIAFGLVFLGQMLGYLGWNVWMNILRLWPLLLVSIGLEVAGKGLRSEAVRALGGLVVIGGLAYGALVMTPTGSWMPLVPVTGEAEAFEWSEAHNRRVTEGVAVIRAGVGQLTVSEGRDLATAEGRSPLESEFEVVVDGDTADVEIGAGTGVWVPTTDEARLDVTLDREGTWDITVDAGVSHYDIDLRELRVRSLSLNAGVSEGTVTLGSSQSSGLGGAVPAEVDAGVSALTIRVPDGDHVRVSMSSGLSGMTTRGTWTSSREGDTRVYESEGFRDSGTYWDIDITSGIGSVTVEYY